MSAPSDVTKRPLPQGWQWVKLGEICEIVAGQSPPSETYTTSQEGLPFFQGKADFGLIHPLPRVWCKEPKVIAKPGDILISIRAPVGPTNLANVECCIGRGLAAIRPQKDVERDFVLLALKWSEPLLVKLGSGSTFQAIRREDLERLEIPLPPLSEQKRIAAILREQMAAVERARRAAEAQLEAAKALPAAFLRRVFPRPGQPLPEGWRWVKLGEVCEVVNGFGFREDLQGREDLPFPFVKVSDMNSSGSEITIQRAANTVDQTILQILGAKTYPAGTVIFPKVGGALLTNKKRILGVEATFDNNIMGLVPKEVESAWLYYWVQTVDLAALARTQALPSIRQSEVADLLFPLPPLSEQQRIAAILREQMAAAERARKAIEAQLEAINKLPAAILRKAFNGEL